jgi:rubrerythrin
MSYLNEAVSEFKRVSKLYPSQIMTMAKYEAKADNRYTERKARRKTGKTFNQIKKLAGLPINKKERGIFKKSVDLHNTGEFRDCNVCGNRFEKGATWLRCPSCDIKASQGASVSNMDPDSCNYHIGFY